MDLVSLLTSMENLIVKNNTITATYDISSNLKKRVQNTYKGVRGFSETVPIPMTVLPSVVVEMDTKTEEFIVVGNTARRDMEILFGIVPVTGYGAGSTDFARSNNLENSDLELIRLVQNIENMVRQNISLSGTVESLEITATDFSNIIKSPDTYVSVARINLLAKLKSRS